jgi:hypothetical protein
MVETTELLDLRQLLEAFPWDSAPRYLPHKSRSEFFASVSQQLLTTQTKLLVGTRALVCYAKTSFLWKGARDTRFDPARNGHGVRLTSLTVGQLSYWYGPPRQSKRVILKLSNAQG